jgi:hypothetical protein
MGSLEDIAMDQTPNKKNKIGLMNIWDCWYSEWVPIAFSIATLKKEIPTKSTGSSSF